MDFLETSDPADVRKRVAAQLRVVARADHCISRQYISPNALRVLYRLRDAGFDAGLVGGAVRDLLLGNRPKDFDVATNATPEQVKALFRNCRLIGRRFRLAHVHYGDEIIEVSTFRGISDDGSGDREMVDGRLTRDNVYGSIEEDAVRRDFTVNALYYAIDDFSVRDYVGGFEDVQRRVLRLIGDVERRFREDPVRTLRAVRFAAKLGFVVADDVAVGIREYGPLLVDAPPARLFDEMLKLFLAGHALSGFREMERYGLFAVLFPESSLAIHKDPRGRALIEAALASTDARIALGKPVTPAFLFAALLWPAVEYRAAALAERGHGDAEIDASAQIVAEQALRIALPKRFSLPMQEIWDLQPRFLNNQRKRVQRLLAHPRFRAAFDFLLLRASAHAELADLAARWEQAQRDGPDAVLAGLPPAPERGAATDAPARKKRRRRRKPGAAAAATE
ncbi:MAG: polynucleotide adenylyltransferase PcnB [Xanthomonadales bacterium]|nr:polynucleotide adenylyltransferase PcnB [Xanthomonadales bacterium]MBK7145661.1 polynucleotide adenylyltransferase PcnB [Xanthomonadales bacterium]MCC6561510.1 polynucleotide adenylyltransferase PcnB [Xanthomonadales bacterium]